MITEPKNESCDWAAKTSPGRLFLFWFFSAGLLTCADWKVGSIFSTLTAGEEARGVLLLLCGILSLLYLLKMVDDVFKLPFSSKAGGMPPPFAGLALMVILSAFYHQFQLFTFAKQRKLYLALVAAHLLFAFALCLKAPHSRRSRNLKWEPNSCGSRWLFQMAVWKVFLFPFLPLSFLRPKSLAMVGLFASLGFYFICTRYAWFVVLARPFTPLHNMLMIDSILLLYASGRVWDEANPALSKQECRFFCPASYLALFLVPFLFFEFGAGPALRREFYYRESGRICLGAYMDANVVSKARFWQSDASDFKDADVFAPRDILPLSPAGRVWQAEKPHVFFLVIDTMRFDFAFDEEGKKHCPNFNRFKEQSVCYANNYVSGNATERSLPHILSGDYFSVENRFKNELGGAGYQYLDSWSLFGGAKNYFLFYKNYQPAKQTTPKVLKEFQRISEQNKSVAVQCHWLDLHAPYRHDKQAVNVLMRYGDSEQSYRKMIHELDEAFGMILDFLDKDPAGKNTLLIVTADHGEEFIDEHNFVMHGYNLFDTLVKVPIFIHFPKQTEPHEVRELTSSLDLMPSLLQRLALNADKTLKAHRPNRSVFFQSTLGNQFGMVQEGRKFLASPRYRFKALFDLVDDAAERKNLADSQNISLEAEAKLREYQSRLTGK